MSSFDLFSIGHSNIPAERFIGLLRHAGVNAIADVRSTPFSRRFPWFSAKSLAATLAQHDMAYLACGEALGGRPRDAALYRDGVADYEAMARQTDFQKGLDRLVADAARSQQSPQAKNHTATAVAQSNRRITIPRQIPRRQWVTL